MPLELAQGIVRVRIDRQQLRAEIRAARREIIRGLSGIRVKVDIDAIHFRRQAESAGRAAGRAAGAAASAGFRESVRRGSATGMVPSGGGMVRSGSFGGYETSPGTFLMGHPAGRRSGTGPRRVGTGFGGRSNRRVGGSPFLPSGFIGGPTTAGPGATGSGASPWAWAGMYGGMYGGGGRPPRGPGGGGRGRRSGGAGGRGFFGSGPMGRFAGGAAFQLNPLLALSAHYGGTAGASGAIGAVAATEGIKAYAEFEDAIKWVKILQREAGATEAAMASLENQARRVGRTTQFSAAEAANAMAVLTKRGFDAGQVQQQLPHVLNLAVAGELDISEAADIVANAQKQFQLGAKDSKEIADLLAKASLDSASDVRTLGVALSYVGPVAKSAGMDLKETLAIIAALEDAGLKGSRAGTGLARVIAKLANKDTEQAFQKIGVEVRQANGQFRSTVELVEELQTALSTLAAPDKYAFFNELFRERGGLALTAVVNQGADAIDRMRKSLEEAGGTSGRIAEERMNSLTRQFEALKNSAKDLGIELGSMFGPGLTDLLKNTRRELEAIRQMLQTDEDFRAEQQRKVDDINARLIAPRVPEPGAGRPLPEPGFGPKPSLPGDLGTFVGDVPGTSLRERQAIALRSRARWTERYRVLLGRRRSADLADAIGNADMFVNPGKGRASGVFGRSGGGIGPATATGMDVVPMPGGATGRRLLTEDEQKAELRSRTKNVAEWIERMRASGENMSDVRKVAADILRRDRVRVKYETTDDNSAAAGPKYAARGGYMPSVMGIQEFQRQTQLGVLDKKDEYLEQISDNTKQTANGIADLKKTGSTFG